MLAYSSLTSQATTLPFSGSARAMVRAEYPVKTPMSSVFLALVNLHSIAKKWSSSCDPNIILLLNGRNSSLGYSQKGSFYKGLRGRRRELVVKAYLGCVWGGGEQKWRNCRCLIADLFRTHPLRHCIVCTCASSFLQPTSFEPQSFSVRWIFPWCSWL